MFGERAHIALGTQETSRVEIAHAGEVGALDLLPHDGLEVAGARFVEECFEQRRARVVAAKCLLVAGGHRVRLARPGRPRTTALVAEARRFGEALAHGFAATRFVLELATDLRRLPVALRGEVVGAQPLEGAGLGEGDDAIHVPRAERFAVQAFHVLEAGERDAVDVSAAEVAGRLEAIGIVRNVAPERRDDLEDSLGGGVVLFVFELEGRGQARARECDHPRDCEQPQRPRRRARGARCGFRILSCSDQHRFQLPPGA